MALANMALELANTTRRAATVVEAVPSAGVVGGEQAVAG